MYGRTPRPRRNYSLPLFLLTAFGLVASLAIPVIRHRPVPDASVPPETVAPVAIEPEDPEPRAPKFVLPTPLKGVFITQRYREFRHEGIDIAGPSGTPILAVANGIVTKAGWDAWGLGKMVSIRHGDGTVSDYGHNSKIMVREGDHVEQGEVIALMGSSGNSSAPHLHFELRRKGTIWRSIDPETVIEFGEVEERLVIRH